MNIDYELIKEAKRHNIDFCKLSRAILEEERGLLEMQRRAAPQEELDAAAQNIATWKRSAENLRLYEVEQRRKEEASLAELRDLNEKMEALLADSQETEGKGGWSGWLLSCLGALSTTAVSQQQDRSAMADDGESKLKAD
ncbi:hypothetical protein HK097_007487 [Rhizophlyctis rosea]|uniref:Uncharacterized protein n=1 Tax=Rhizophlyctis rosea TaxID=64517 RepID=A0AAD5SLQ4_9FUNG|nr:hypothetical protein HK097_007487 [Rhizophlyctis rosea]